MSITHRVNALFQRFRADLYIADEAFTCSVLASTAAGDGPPTDGITVTTGKRCVCH